MKLSKKIRNKYRNYSVRANHKKSQKTLRLKVKEWPLLNFKIKNIINSKTKYGGEGNTRIIGPSLSGFWSISNIVNAINMHRRNLDTAGYLTGIEPITFNKVKEQIGDGLIKGNINDLFQFVNFYDKTTEEKVYVFLTGADDQVTHIYYEDIKIIFTKNAVQKAITNANNNKGQSKNIGLYSAGIAERNLLSIGSTVLHNSGISIEAHGDKGVDNMSETETIIPKLNTFNVLIASAGMEAILPSIICNLTYRPVIVVPSSVGYGYSGQGVSAILSQELADVPGLAIFNIDNMPGACVCAAKINAIMKKIRETRPVEVNLTKLNEIFGYKKITAIHQSDIYLQIRNIIPRQDEDSKWNVRLANNKTYNASNEYSIENVLERKRFFDSIITVQIVVSSDDPQIMDVAMNCRALLMFNGITLVSSSVVNEALPEIITINDCINDGKKLLVGDIIITISGGPGLLPNIVGAVTSKFANKDCLVIALPITSNTCCDNQFKIMLQNCVAGIPVMQPNNFQSTASFVSLILFNADIKTMNGVS